jgi:hypothetical protein
MFFPSFQVFIAVVVFSMSKTTKRPFPERNFSLEINHCGCTKNPDLYADFRSEIKFQKKVHRNQGKSRTWFLGTFGRTVFRDYFFS